TRNSYTPEQVRPDMKSGGRQQRPPQTRTVDRSGLRPGYPRAPHVLHAHAVIGALWSTDPTRCHSYLTATDPRYSSLTPTFSRPPRGRTPPGRENTRPSAFAPGRHCPPPAHHRCRCKVFPGPHCTGSRRPCPGRRSSPVSLIRPSRLSPSVRGRPRSDRFSGSRRAGRREKTTFDRVLLEQCAELATPPVKPGHDRPDVRPHDLGDLLVGTALDVGEVDRDPEVLGEFLQRLLHVAVGKVFERHRLGRLQSRPTVRSGLGQPPVLDLFGPGAFRFTLLLAIRVDESVG